MDIAGWLRGLGLERYEQAFRDNDIDQSPAAARRQMTSSRLA